MTNKTTMLETTTLATEPDSTKATEPDPTNEFVGLDPAQLLQKLVDEEDHPALELIDACAAHGEVMVEALRAVIGSEPPWTCDNLGEWWLLLHAAMILGRMPSESAGVLLTRLIQRIDEHGDFNLQDWLTDLWAGLFANKPASVEQLIQDLIQNRSLRWLTRCVAAQVLLAAGARAVTHWMRVSTGSPPIPQTRRMIKSSVLWWLPRCSMFHANGTAHC